MPHASAPAPPSQLWPLSASHRANPLPRRLATLLLAGVGWGGFRWVILDRILSPEQYFFDFRLARAEANSSTGDTKSRPGGFAAEPSKSEAPKMGDKYLVGRETRAAGQLPPPLSRDLCGNCLRLSRAPQAQRAEFEEGIEASQFVAALDTGWVCPYDEKMLLALRAMPEGLLRTEEDRKIRYLVSPSGAARPCCRPS